MECGAQPGAQPKPRPGAASLGDFPGGTSPGSIVAAVAYTCSPIVALFYPSDVSSPSLRGPVHWCLDPLHLQPHPAVHFVA